MGKAERNRKRRQRQSGHGHPWTEVPPGAVRGGTQAAVSLAADIFEETQMPCRTAFLDDPLFGGPKAAVTAIQPDGSVLTDGEIINPGPVVLFEPIKVMMVKDTRTGTVHEARTEGVISGGFHRVPRGIMASLPAEGWNLYRTATGLMLCDTFEGIWAEGTLELDPAWVSEATSQGWVTVFFGPRLGVRIPPHTSAQSYTLQQRIAEFRQGRSEGLCAAASVKWHPVAPQETRSWVLLPAGTFGQPLPVAYMPQLNFTRLGGPEAFGFVRTPERLADIPIAVGVTAEVTPTDVDLVQPHLDDSLNFVGGYRAPGGATDLRYAAWHAAAHTHGQILVITGHQDFPAGHKIRHDTPEDVDKRVLQVMGASYAATVSVSDTPRRAPLA
ncbi:hypothetical protein SAMN05216276_108626 [Streptosporangium subroseum]|uniref:Uncharacterized protein n=1 Tax=Streptosporangium subroseum TaxID=106412 RepID=A0A239P5R2_9ACTN|nr:hypothetical protein [Streptosporangium subroseum]SNT61948.1 hypothetical protein SAMN05216276_108626 [Streptosporangium subroseum]